MGLIDTATAPLRYVLFGAEHEAMSELMPLEAHVMAAVDAIRETTKQLEAHAAVIEQLAATLTPLSKAMTELSVQMPELVESVGSLNAKLEVVSDVLEPLVQAEHDIAHAEHEVTKIGNLFSRHKTTPATPES